MGRKEVANGRLGAGTEQGWVILYACSGQLAISQVRDISQDGSQDPFWRHVSLF